MTRLEATAARYARCAGLIRRGVELDIVGDPVGARLDAAARRLVLMARDDDPGGLWDDVLGPTKSLRWRLLTQPQPTELSTSVQLAAAAVAAKARDLRPAVAVEAQQVLNELANAAEAVAANDPAVGALLVESILEATTGACVVIAAGGAAAVGLERWLGPKGVRVRTVTELLREQISVESGYVVGPPRLFPASLVTAPMTDSLNFIFPAWFTDRALPRSPLATWAEGAVMIHGREFLVGDTTRPEAGPGEEHDETVMLPQATWVSAGSPPRLPVVGEVAARCLHLSGGYRMWLDDDGEWIRAVDPSQPGGARIVNIDIEEVRPGVYLLLRDGQTERRALYEAALQLMGPERQAVEDSQAAWKGALKDRLDRLGRTTVIRRLADAGVRTLDRVPAWIDPLLARPRSNHDFKRLLQWLDVPIHPTYELATALRSLRIKASNQIGDQLEAVVAGADMARLEREGHLRLELDIEGFRGVIATRVIDISPYLETIPHYEARVLQPDRSATWRE